MSRFGGTPIQQEPIRSGPRFGGTPLSPADQPFTGYGGFQSAPAQPQAPSISGDFRTSGLTDLSTGLLPPSQDPYAMLEEQVRGQGEQRAGMDKEARRQKVGKLRAKYIDYSEIWDFLDQLEQDETLDYYDLEKEFLYAVARVKQEKEQEKQQVKFAEKAAKDEEKRYEKYAKEQAAQQEKAAQSAFKAQERASQQEVKREDDLAKAALKADTDIERELIKYERAQPSRQARGARAEQPPTIGQQAAGLGAEVVIGGAGQVAGAALAPFTAGISYPVLSFAGGFSGSLAAQEIEGRRDISWGRAIRDGLLNLIPGAKPVKAATRARQVIKTIGRGAAIGAGAGAAGEVIETGIEEQRLPSIEELAAGTAGGAAVGGAFTAFGEAFRSAYGKFAGRSTKALDDAYKAGDPDARLVVDTLRKTSKDAGLEEPTVRPEAVTPEPIPEPVRTPEPLAPVRQPEPVRPEPTPEPIAPTPTAREFLTPAGEPPKPRIQIKPIEQKTVEVGGKKYTQLKIGSELRWFGVESRTEVKSAKILKEIDDAVRVREKPVAPEQAKPADFKERELSDKRLYWNDVEFNVSEADRIIKAETTKKKTLSVDEIKRAKLPDVLVDKKYASKADLKKPIILAYPTEGAFEPRIIDGYHRAERAISEGVPIEAIVLSKEQSKRLYDKAEREKQYAIPVRETKEVPVGEGAGDRPPVGEGVKAPDQVKVQEEVEPIKFARGTIDRVQDILSKNPTDEFAAVRAKFSGDDNYIRQAIAVAKRRMAILRGEDPDAPKVQEEVAPPAKPQDVKKLPEKLATKSEAQLKEEGYVGPFYHGSPDWVGEKFDPKMRGRNTGLSRGGFSFTDDEATARAFAKAKASKEQSLVDDANSVMREAQRRLERGEEIPGYEEAADFPEFNTLYTDDINDLRSYLLEVADTLPEDLKKRLKDVAASSLRLANPKVHKVYLKNPKEMDISGKKAWIAENPDDVVIVDTKGPKESFTAPEAPPTVKPAEATPIATRKEVQSEAKKIGLPSTGPTKEVSRLVDIAKRDPSTWTKEEFDTMLPHLSVHRVVGRAGQTPEELDKITKSIQEKGLQGGMVDGLDSIARGEFSWGKGVQDRTVVLVTGSIKRKGSSPYIESSGSPIAVIRTDKPIAAGDSEGIYNAIRRGGAVPAEATKETLPPAGEAPSYMKAREPLLARATELGISTKGTNEEIQTRIAKREKVMSFIDNVETGAKQRLSELQKTTTLGSNKPLGMAVEYTIIGASKMARGTVKFADWSREMVSEFGDAIKPYLRQIYQRAITINRKDFDTPEDFQKFSTKMAEGLKMKTTDIEAGTKIEPPPGMVERQTITRAAEGTKLTKEAEALRESGEAFREVTPLKALAEKAVKDTEENSAATWNSIKSELDPKTKVSRAVGYINAQVEKGVDVTSELDELAKAGTDAGTILRAMREIKMGTPAGRARIASDGFIAFAKTKKQQVSPEELSEIRKRFETAEKSTDESERMKLYKEAVEYSVGKLKLRPKDWIDAYRYTNTLSSPRTHERNIVGNVFNVALNRPLALIGQGDLKGALTYTGNAAKSIGEAADRFKNVFKGESIPVRSTDDMTSAAAKDDFGKEYNKKIPKVFQVIPKFLEAQDQFFSQIIKGGEVQRLIARGVDPKIAAEKADQLAENYLYRDRIGETERDKSANIFSRAVDGIGIAAQGLKRQENMLGKLADQMIMFVRTPVKIAERGFEFSPLGYIAPGTRKEGGKLWQRNWGLTDEGIAQGKYGKSFSKLNDEQKTDVVFWKKERIGRANAGTAITALGGLMAMEGNTTFKEPSDPEEKAAFYESGRKPYAVKIGDKWVPYITFGPAALAFAIPAAVRDWSSENPNRVNNSTAENIAQMATGLANFFMTQTPVDGMAKMFQTITGQMGFDQTKLMETLGFTASQYIPLSSLQRYINQWMDGEFKKTSGFWEEIKQNVVGQSKDLIPYTTMEGLPAKRTAWDLLPPFSVGVDKPGDNLKERRLELERKNLATKKADTLVKDYKKGLITVEEIINFYNSLDEDDKQGIRRRLRMADENIAKAFDAMKSPASGSLGGGLGGKLGGGLGGKL